VGKGLHTSFWRDTWVGDAPLQDRFPRLFSISLQKEASVAEVSCSNSGLERWRRSFFEWEKALLIELMESINIW
jgi:hypothetical protein